ncbi:type II secretion system protein GspJ [Polyangium aurulentum]|uniref:type II secretion system protein GspJ n=1 Tax=Polyangium aurulentum TaxID=2567896 RepID=UPI00146D21E6|nr:type II secretion system protein GspJ [Polyangium aurulentum]UQA60816.1 prepilin-type N-terminal cleavage/methylation domain-containing protein [Polyangium aurulentum]
MLHRARSRGMTLLEVMVAIGVLALLGSLIYGAFDGMSRSRRGLERIDDRYHQGRNAVSRITREVAAAFISRHVPPNAQMISRKTGFMGKKDQLDFTSFAHRKTFRDAHESDQSEIGYFIGRDPDGSHYNLMRRESKYIDDRVDQGGAVSVLAEDVESLSFEYQHPITYEWTDTWDSTQAAGQPDLLPLAVKVTLVLNGGIGNEPLKITTKAPLAMQVPLKFANP